MADTCSIITAKSAPRHSILARVSIEDGFKQMLRPVDAASKFYGSDINATKADIVLAPNVRYVGPATSFLYIDTDSPVDLIYTLPDAKVGTLRVNQVLVLDTHLAGFEVVNTPGSTPTTAPSANVSIVFIGKLRA